MSEILIFLGITIAFIILCLFIEIFAIPIQCGAEEKEKEIFKNKYDKEINEAVKKLSEEERKKILLIINKIIEKKKEKLKDILENLNK